MTNFFPHLLHIFYVSELFPLFFALNLNFLGQLEGKTEREIPLDTKYSAVQESGKFHRTYCSKATFCINIFSPKLPTICKDSYYWSVGELLRWILQLLESKSWYISYLCYLLLWCWKPRLCRAESGWEPRNPFTLLATTSGARVVFSARHFLSRNQGNHYVSS